MDLSPKFEVRLAHNSEDLRAVQRLRYDIFVSEMGATGLGIDCDQMLEIDDYDPHCLHLILFDLSRGAALDDQVVGAYRLLTIEGAKAAGSFYSESEFDLSPLLQSKRPIMELGRSCLRKPYRDGEAMFHMWQALARLFVQEGVEILFGTASFMGTDIETLTQPLALLHQKYLLPVGIRPKTLAPAHVSLQRLPMVKVDQVGALRVMPALIKAYLRLGGGVGDGVYIDRAFNTTDVCLVLDIKTMNSRQKAIYLKGSNP